MILTQADIDEFVEAYRKYCNFEDVGFAETWSSEDVLAWLTEHPQVVVAAGFQEFVAGGESSLYRALVAEGELDDLNRPIFKQYSGSWVIPSVVGEIPQEKWGAFRLEDLIEVSELERELARIDRNKFPTEYDNQRDFIDHKSLKSIMHMPSFDEILEAAGGFIDNPLVDPTVWVSPKLWTPSRQAFEKLHLQNTAISLIKNIRYENLQLDALHWREFEEVVAEVLRSLGMEIHLVTENPQGGRDIIARAPAMAGIELATIAIEVKHRDVIDRPILQQAIQQNNHFPSLMLVTSGRFTAGVVREAAKPENRMRVSLKDGVAIRDMIKSYKLT